MLLNKYEKYDLISKDQYTEELLFKFEKNFTHFKQFDTKAKELIEQMIAPIVNEIFADINNRELKTSFLIQDNLKKI